VAAVRRLTPTVIEVDLRMVEPPALAFEAGQWVSVPFGPRTVRAWSMASPPTRPALITLCMDVAPGGLGSRWVLGLSPGDPVEFKGPTGGFVLTPADPRRPLLVAEEIGIVPVRSILLDLYERGWGRPTTLVFWAPEPGGLIYDAEFRRLARRQPGFRYVPVVRQAPAGWTGERGELAPAVDRVVESADGLVAYVCGGGEAIRQVREVLMAKGMDRKAVRWEKFW
jgi:Na+-transporting NADH:ubiquinone oxidoreductase subunit F